LGGGGGGGGFSGVSFGKLRKAREHRQEGDWLQESRRARESIWADEQKREEELAPAAGGRHGLLLSQTCAQPG